MSESLREGLDGLWSPQLVRKYSEKAHKVLLDVAGEHDALTARLTELEAENERIRPLFENLAREYPIECNKRVNAEAERDGYAAVIAEVHKLLSELDLDSGKVARPGTAWGSILRECMTALAPADALTTPDDLAAAIRSQQVSQ